MREEIVVGRSATIGLQLFDDEARVASSTDVTVEVRRADGTVLVAAGTATTEPPNSIGRYELTLTPAQLDEVDLLTATWAVTLDGVAQTRQTTVEVIGAHYFELAELRAMPGLSDPARFPLSKLAATRVAVGDEMERELGVALVERFGQRALDGLGSCTVWLRPFVRRLLGGSLAGSALTTDQLGAITVQDTGYVEWVGGRFSGSLVLRFAHGYSANPSPEMHDIALELGRHRLLGWRSSLADQTVDADDLGQQTALGEASDRQLNQDRMFETLRAWRAAKIGPAIA